MIAQIDSNMVRKRPGSLFGRLCAYFLFEGRPITTKGQWINPLVFSMYRLAQHVPTPRKVDAPVFIVGTGRSGTTLLGKLFALHKDVQFLNEPKALWHFAHGEEDIIGSYADRAGKVRLDIPSDLETLAQKISNVYGWAAFFAGAIQVADKYPELIYRTDFVQALFPGAKMVAIVRDGVDTCNSVTLWSKRKGTETEGGRTDDWWGRDGRKWRCLVDELIPENSDLAPLQQMLFDDPRHEDRSAVEWILSMREVQKQVRAHPDSIISIKYEDLCADPETLLARIFDFCGLDTDRSVIDYAKVSLEKAVQPKPLALHPELIAPFCNTLRELGYEDSVSRVVEFDEKNG
ncbi:MAG: sulfotransferase family protein [Rhizobiaceae bacterium]|nr:sulfotransferase family protein [Rhizobiaceae bacterium]